MKYAVLSDIHSNLEALEVALKRIDRERADGVFCLGDIVGYGPNPNECIEKVRTLCRAAVLGNHDAALTGHTPIHFFNSYARDAIEWSERIITEDNLEFLKSLPLTHREDGLLMVHATPKDPEAWNYIHTETEAGPQFDYLSDDTTALIGHSHIPAVFERRERKQRIINVGSIGQPRDRDPRACCVILDTESGNFDWIREVYTVQDTARKIRHAGLPEFLAVRLFIGM